MSDDASVSPGLHPAPREGDGTPAPGPTAQALRPAVPTAAAAEPGEPTRRGTLVERAIDALPGPYALWALLLSAVFGTPGFIVVRYFDTGSVDQALSLFEPNLPSVLTYFLATFGITVYALLGIRFMGTRTRAVQNELVPLVPGGQGSIDRAFRPVTSVLAPAILTPVLALVSFAAYPDQIQDITGAGYLTLRIVSIPVVYFAYATFIWVYLSSIRSLDRLGKGPLQLASFLQDAHFGLKPFGSLSLFLALVYFIGLVLVAFSFLALQPLFIALLGGLAVPGVVLFFLPLYGLHVRMMDEGRKAQASVAAAYDRVAPMLNPATTVIGPAAAGLVPSLLAIQILEHRADDIRRWPLDLRTMSWFSAILLSVAAAIATRYVLSYLGG